MKIDNIPFLLVIISLLVSTVILRFSARLLFGSKTYLNEEITFVVVLIFCEYRFSNFLLRTLYHVAIALIGIFDTSVYIEFVTSKLPIIILLLIFIICAYPRGQIEIGMNREKIGFEKIGFVKGGILVIIQFTSFFLLLFCMSRFGYF